MPNFKSKKPQLKKAKPSLNIAVPTIVPEATENNENANDLVQSHEFELEHAFTNWWLMQFTLGTEQPLHEDFNLSDVEIESEFGLIKRKGDGIALSFQVGYEQAINHGEEKEASTIGFCPLSNSPAESC
jgi:hypothetical protein